MINEASNQYGNALYAANTSPLIGLAGLLKVGKTTQIKSKKTKMIKFLPAHLSYGEQQW